MSGHLARCLWGGGLLSLVALGIIWGTSLPLGIPGEWTWERGFPGPDAPWNAILLVLPAAFLVGTLAGGDRLLAGSPSAGREALALTGLILAGGVWFFAVQESAPVGQRHDKVPFVLYYPNSSGYYFEMRRRDESLDAFFRGYADWMREGDVLHVGTHPPGLFLLFRGIMAACETFPGAAGAVLELAPESFHEASDVVAGNSLSSGMPSFDPRQRAVLWLAYLVAVGCVVLTIIPLYLTLRRVELNPMAAWWACGLWITVPSLAIFLPKSDAAFTLPSMLLVYCGVSALRRRSIAWSVAGAVVLWLAMQFSLAFLPVAAALFLLVGLVAWKRPDDGPTLRELLVMVGTGAAAFVLLSVGLWAATGLNLAEVWWLNYRNHAGFYGEYPRTGWLWRVVNPIEFAISLGLPCAVLAVSGAATAFRGLPTARDWSTLVAAALATTMVLLWLSGKNSGEAARLWLLLTPWCGYLVGIAIGRGLGVSGSRGVLLALTVVQTAGSAVTIWGISGFHLKP
ncbi:MAG: hypothetical protein KF777_08220 [Planctomycetaceae bacterium]|nr:hypothetical protein [Planctomycetaceae bacterium]